MNKNIHWLSFCDVTKKPGTQFLGVAIIPAEDFTTAVKESHFLRCNPGGEVQGLEIKKSDKICAGFRESDFNRLLTKAEIEEIQKRLKEVVGDRQ